MLHQRVAVLPLGAQGPGGNEYSARLAALRGFGAELDAGPAVSEEAEAAEAARALAAREPDLLLIVPFRGMSARAMATAGRAVRSPVLIWPMEGDFALPSSALATGALRQSGARAELLFGPAHDPATLERASSVLRAAGALSRLSRCRIGTIGGLFPNLVSCGYEPGALHARLGVTVVPVGYDEVRQRMGQVSAADLAEAREGIEGACRAPGASALSLEPGLRLHLALKRIAAEQRIQGFAAECWSGLPAAVGLNPCLGFMDDAYAMACEGDVHLCVGLLVVQWLSGRMAYAGDLYDCSLDGLVTLVHCGGPASLARGPGELVVGPSQRARERGFETMTCRPVLPEGPATLLRLSGPGCEKAHVAQGRVTGCDTSPDLKVRVRLDGDRWEFLRRCEGNHYIVAPGDLRGELGLLAEWCDIAVQETGNGG